MQYHLSMESLYKKVVLWFVKCHQKIHRYWDKLQHKMDFMLEEEKNFMRDTSLSTLKKPALSAHFILWGAVLFFFVAFIWANLAVIDEVAAGDGKVVPSRKVQVIQNLEGGIVSDILVKEGDIVSKNQILMHIDDKRFSSSFQEGALKALALQAKVARLTAEASGMPFVEPTDPKLKEHPEFIVNERNLLESHRHEQAIKLQTLTKEAKQQEQELASLKARFEQLKTSHRLVNRELQMTSPLVAKGAASEVEVLRLERQVNDLKGDMTTTELAIPKAEASIDEINSKINELDAAFRSNAQNELNQAKNELAPLQASNVALEDRFDRTAIRSPVKGTVKKISVSTVGGVVQPGMDLMEIVPLDDSLLIEARIRPADIGFMHPGQKAMVKITAYDFSVYGGIEGTVEQISADSLTDEKGNSYYQISVRTNKNYLGGNGKKRLEIIPGMVARVDIITGEKTVWDYLMKPILKTKENALRER